MIYGCSMENKSNYHWNIPGYNKNLMRYQQKMCGNIFGDTMGHQYDLDEFDHDLTSWRHWNDGECIVWGNHLQMALWLYLFSGGWIFTILPGTLDHTQFAPVEWLLQ